MGVEWSGASPPVYKPIVHFRFVIHGGEEGMESHILLDCGPLGSVPSLGWDAHNKPRPGLSPDTFHDRFPHKEPLAFFDRNCITEDCNRKVLLVRGKDEMFIFTASGDAIDEPSDGVTKGQQTILGQEGSFIHDWKHEYYRLPPHAQTDASASLVESLKPGCRVAIAFRNTDAGEVSWYGGLIFEYRSAVDQFVIGFDDGDLRSITTASLTGFFEQKCLRFPDADEGGIVANATGQPMVACATRNKEGRAPESSLVGFLVGETTHAVGGDTIYQTFYQHGEAGEPEAMHRTRGGGGDDEAKEFGRGLHTFRRGDIVEHLSLDVPDTEQRCTAHVFGVTYREREKGVPGAKYLILQEPQSAVFFLGMWTQWCRVHEGDRASWQCENDDTARVMGSDAVATMVQQWSESEKLAHLSSRWKVQNHARHISQHGPPHYEQQQKASQQQQKLETLNSKKAAAKAALAATKAAKAAAAAAAAAKAAENKPNAQEQREGRRGRNRGRNHGGDKSRKPASKTPSVNLRFSSVDGAASESDARSDAFSLLDSAWNDVMQGDGAQDLLCAAAPAPADVYEASRSPPLGPPQKRQRQSARLSPSLPEGWKQAVSGEGVLYFYNKALGISQFHYPGTATPPNSTSTSPVLPPPRARLPTFHSLAAGEPPAMQPAARPPSDSNGFFARQRRAQIARLRAMVSEARSGHGSHDDLLKLRGDLAALEMEAYEAGDTLG